MIKDTGDGWHIFNNLFFIQGNLKLLEHRVSAGYLDKNLGIGPNKP